MRSRLTGWAFVAAVAVVATAVCTYLVIQTKGAALDVTFDPETKALKVAASGGSAIDLTELLSTAFQKHPASTLAVLTSWGKPRGILDTNDDRALSECGLVRQAQFWPVWNTLRNLHCNEGNVPFFEKLLAECEGRIPPAVRPVTVTWHSGREVNPDTVLFPKGESWFADRLNRSCDLVLGDAQIPVTIHRSVRIGADRVQISEGTFVRLVSAAKRTIPPLLNSREWIRLRGVGAVQAEIRC